MAEILLKIIDSPANKNENPYIPSIVSIKIIIIKGLIRGIKLKCPFIRFGKIQK